MINWLLLPLAEIFGLVSLVRRELYRCGVFSAERAGVPVIVVGNIVAGGGGKTPIVIALVQALQARGLIPGVAARGVGGNNEGVLMVEDDTDWRRCGDEPLLVRRRTGAMVCVARRRINAVRQLSAAGCDVILCDDGLQHYALRRDMEICAVNGAFGLGNGWLLPAGPLRESCRRLHRCDWVAVSGEEEVAFNHPKMARVIIETDGIYASSLPDKKLTAADFADQRVVAVAGIASPQRFFDKLQKMGIQTQLERSLPDHGRLADVDFFTLAADAVVMTEKDAIKYPQEDKRLYVLCIRAVLPPELIDSVINKIYGF
ncbi:tetraacyldisaccharide 4'-kinase [Candidatus Persebacteraceae bacterium Df01]|uniref:Tetraacyldisaccharide 4'-kinase n=1 Tax=Candidatus Doriopsillibacter californiensis TaxID=2970740 RepID=A0ABT7QK24_9GAMM|nr:tetraacyldisaccharide 4'-kinase [Candidatus Persebacteraceae bacterium Df01]